MAEKSDKSGKEPSRIEQAQKRAQAMANRKPSDPGTFFREVLTELKKTTWPSREVLTKSTTVVLALVLAVAIWVGGLDAILSRVMNPLFSGH
jgi:preprotein translocase subunit SecE